MFRRKSSTTSLTIPTVDPYAKQGSPGSPTSPKGKSSPKVPSLALSGSKKLSRRNSSDLALLASLKAQDKEERHRTITAMTPRTYTRLEELGADFDEIRSELCGVPPQVAEARAAAMAEQGAGELDMGVGEPDIYDFDYMQSQSDYMSTPRF